MSRSRSAVINHCNHPTTPVDQATGRPVVMSDDMRKDLYALRFDITPCGPEGQLFAPADQDEPQPTKGTAPDPLPTGQADVPRIGEPWYGQGGTYAGIARGADGAPDHHLILSPAKPTGDVDWPDALAWAAKLVSGNQTDWALPNRVESALLFANLRDQFDKRWHWTSEAYADDDAYAWNQYFDYGGQGNDHKSYEAQARAVRRLLLRSFNPS